MKDQRGIKGIKKIICLVLVIVMVVGLTVSAVAQSDLTVHIDGQSTNLGISTTERDGWHFAEASAFAETFGFDLLGDVVGIGERTRHVDFLISETIPDFLRERFIWAGEDFDFRAVMTLTAVLVEGDAPDPFVATIWSSADGDGFMTGLIGDPRAEDGWDYFPRPIIIDNAMHVPLETVSELLGYSIAVNNNTIQINTANSAWRVRLTGGNDLSSPQPPPTTPTTPTAAPINVLLDGTALTFDVPPQMVDGRTLVPLRAIFEALGAEVDWNDATRTITATKDATTVVLALGSTTPTVNGQTVTIDVPAAAIDGRTLVPLRFVAESFGVEVNWDGDTRTVTITS